MTVDINHLNKISTKTSNFPKNFFIDSEGIVFIGKNDLRLDTLPSIYIPKFRNAGNKKLGTIIKEWNPKTDLYCLVDLSQKDKIWKEFLDSITKSLDSIDDLNDKFIAVLLINQKNEISKSDLKDCIHAIHKSKKRCWVYI